MSEQQEKPESVHVREEQEWLNEYTGWLKGTMYDPPKAVSHPQHAEAVMSWMTALKKNASAIVTLEAERHLIATLESDNARLREALKNADRHFYLIAGQTNDTLAAGAALRYATDVRAALAAPKKEEKDARTS